MKRFLAHLWLVFLAAVVASAVEFRAPERDPTWASQRYSITSLASELAAADFSSNPAIYGATLSSATWTNGSVAIRWNSVGDSPRGGYIALPLAVAISNAPVLVEIECSVGSVTVGDSGGDAIYALPFLGDAPALHEPGWYPELSQQDEGYSSRSYVLSLRFTNVWDTLRVYVGGDPGTARDTTWTVSVVRVTTIPYIQLGDGAPVESFSDFATGPVLYVEAEWRDAQTNSAGFTVAGPVAPTTPEATLGTSEAPWGSAYFTTSGIAVGAGKLAADDSGVLLAITPMPAVEVVTNGQFDTGTGGWDGYGFDYDADHQAIRPYNWNESAYISYSFAAAEELTVTFSFDVYLENDGVPEQGSLGVDGFANNPIYASGASNTVTGTATLTPADGVAVFRIYLAEGSTPYGVTNIYLDNISVVAGGGYSSSPVLVADSTYATVTNGWLADGFTNTVIVIDGRIKEWLRVSSE